MTNILVPRLPTIVWARPADAQPADPGGMPTWVAERLITTYTTPGTVITATGHGAHILNRVATRLGRRASVEVPDPVRLAVLTPPTVTADPDQLAGWADLLDAHGVLALVTDPATDPTNVLTWWTLLGTERAGLSYTQHIVVTGPLDPPGDRPLDEHPISPAPEVTLTTTTGRTRHPVLTDIRIFTPTRADTEHTDTTPVPEPIPLFRATSPKRASAADHTVRAAA